MPTPTGRPVPPPPRPVIVPPPPMPKAAKHGMGKGPALLLATILGIGLTELVTQGRPIRAFNRINPIHRMSQFRVLGNYLSHIGHKDRVAPVKPVATKPHRVPPVCNPKEPYPKDPEQWCQIPADVLEEHCHPGIPNQHTRTWPGEGDPIGPDATRISDWKNCDSLNNFHKAITGQSSPGQVAADANDAFQSVDPNLNVGNVGKVMPYISGSQRVRAGDPPFAGAGSDPQITIPAPPADPRTINARPTAPQPPATAPQ